MSALASVARSVYRALLLLHMHVTWGFVREAFGRGMQIGTRVGPAPTLPISC